MTSSPTLVQPDLDRQSSPEIEPRPPSAVPQSWASSPVIVALLLALGTLLLYQPALRNGFVNYDDPTYVTANPHVLAGITLQNLRWALTSIVAGHWHPLTMISHMLDVQLFGTNPMGHHLDNVILHTLNVALLFLFLTDATHRTGRSAIVAALFAVFPMNVEAIAWIADRKAPLSLTFMLLALLAYLGYVRKPTPTRYGTVLLCFVLGLMSEATVITFPCVLLLLDYWPLRRFEPAHESSPDHAPVRKFGALVFEKLPLFGISAASAIITAHAASVGSAAASLANFPLSLRIKNAFYSYGMYLLKSVWPANLAAFYPHPGHTLPLWKVALALAVILAITAFVLWRREQRYLLFGWLWFLGTMAPVIGLGQSGLQGMADRYAYIPFIGVFVALTWFVADIGLASRFAPACAALAIVGYGCASHVQMGYWRDTYTLFSHAALVTPRNGVAEDNLGLVLEYAGHTDQALPHYQAASVFMPTWSTPHFHIARALQSQHHIEEAAGEYQDALTYETDPAEAAQAFNNLGTIYVETGRLQDALACFDSALKIFPDSALGLTNRGVTEFKLGQLGAANADLSRAIQIEASPQTHFWLASVLESQGKVNEAEAEYVAALRLDPTFGDAKTRLDALREQKHPQSPASR